MNKLLHYPLHGDLAAAIYPDPDRHRTLVLLPCDPGPRYPELDRRLQFGRRCCIFHWWLGSFPGYHVEYYPELPLPANCRIFPGNAPGVRGMQAARQELQPLSWLLRDREFREYSEGRYYYEVACLMGSLGEGTQ